MNKCKLGDLFYIKQGYAFKSEKYVSHSNYILCTLANFSESNNFKFFPEKATYYPDEFSHEFILCENDLIIPLTEKVVGLFGNTAFVPKTEGFQFVLNQRVGKIIPYEEKADKLFLHYLLSTQLVRDQIEATASGTKQRNTSPDKIYDVTVWVPNIDQQRIIGRYLYSLEQKCNVNNKICSELETMAKILYDYWFVQFDFPDENGNPYRTSGGEMEWNEQLKREIPKGWKVGNLYSIADFINGLACQKFRPKDGERAIPVIKIKEMHDGITAETEQVSENIPSKHKISDGDILFSWSATLEVMYWYGGSGGLNQHIFKVNPKSYFPKEYVYEQLSSYIVNFVKMAEARKTTMGHITTDHLEQSKIPLSPESLIKQFKERIYPIHLKIGQTKQENRELTKLRDWLLPMLMNGQARVE